MKLWLARLLVALMLLVTIALLAAGGLYAAFPDIVTTYGERLLAQSGVRLDALDIGRPEWSGIDVAHVQLTTDAGTIVLNNVRVAYQATALTERDRTTVTVEQATVRLAQTGSEAPTPPPEPAAVQALLAELWRQLPFARVDVRSAAVSWPPYTFAGSVELTPAIARVDGVLAESEPVPELEVTVELTPAGELDGVVRAADGRNSVRATGRLHPAAAEVSIDWHQSVIDAAGATVGVSVSGNTSMTLADAVVDVGPGLSAEISHPSAQGEVAVAAVSTAWPFEHARVAGDWRMTATLDERHVTTTGTLAGFVSSSAANVTVTALDATMTDAYASELVSVDTVSVQLAEAVNAQFTIEPPEVHIADAALTTTFSRVATPAGTFDVTADIALRETSATPDRVNTNIDASAVALDLSVQATADLDLTTNVANVSFTASQQIGRPLLASLFDTTPDYELDSGTVTATGQLKLETDEEDGLEADVALTVRDADARYDELAAFGVDADVDIRLAGGALDIRSDAVRCRLADVGFPLTDLVATGMTVDGSTLRLDGLVGNALGGGFSAPAVDFDLDSGDGGLELTLDGLGLADMMALEGESIDGDGVIDGTIPIAISGYAVAVTDGRMSARPPGGVIRYSAAQTVAGSLGQPGIEFAVAALSDFRFDHLTADVRFEPDGELAIAVRLEGNNPAYERGRRIHYNLNVTQNLLTLLKSLQLADDLTQTVERRINQ